MTSFRSAPSDLVVIGLGYVGLPLARAASQAGLLVHGLEADPARVETLNGGRSHVDDLGDADIAEMLDAGFRATVDSEILAGADTIVVCVPTPLDEDRSPELGAVRAAGEAIAGALKAGTLVVLESTTWPGTTQEVLVPILEKSGLRAGIDFNVAYSPERIDPGNPHFGIVNTPKVVGGLTAACRDRAVAFYAKFVDEVVPVSGLREAEMAKLIENTYRHVNIALVNEMSIFCDEMGIDLWDAIGAASSKPFGFQAFWPGPGVGGHCIPIDPNYLSFKVRRLGYPFRFVELAQEVNERMPAYVVSRVTRALNRIKKSVNGSTVLLLGVAYKPDIADQRETPATPIAHRLAELGAQVIYADPHVAEWSVDGVVVERVADPVDAVAKADISVLLQAHAAFDLEALGQRSALLLDTRGVMSRSETTERL